MRNGPLWVLGVALGAFQFSVFASKPVTETANFTDALVPEGWTVADGVYVSPEYSNSVSHIALSYAATRTEQAGEAQLFATRHAGGTETQIATVNTFATGVAFDFPETAGCRRFRIVTDGLAIGSFSATWLDTRLDAPANTVASAVSSDTIEVSWNAVDGAAGYHVSVWTNAVVGTTAGTVVWEDALPGATNAPNSTKLTDQKFNACFAKTGWIRSAGASGYPTGVDGTLRIGTQSDSGWLQTPPISTSGDGIAVCFSAWAEESNTKSMAMSIERISGDEVVSVGKVDLSTDTHEFVVSVPGWNSGDSIRFNSLASGNRKTVLGGFAVLSGYSAGVSTPDVFKTVDVDDGVSCMIDGLPDSTVVNVGVQAVDGDGVLSDMTEGVTVDLSKVAVLNACPLSSLVGNVYTQNFDTVARVTSETGDKDFYNGITIPYWQAWQDGGPAAKIAFYSGGNQTGAKFVALATNVSDKVRAFGARTRQGTTMTWGIAFTNDTDAVMILERVSYAAQQWGFANTAEQSLVCSYLTTNQLVRTVDVVDGWTECCDTAARCLKGEEHDMPVATAVEEMPAEECRIAPGMVVVLRWKLEPPSSGNSALMAIDDLSITFQSVARPTVIRITSHEFR